MKTEPKDLTLELKSIRFTKKFFSYSEPMYMVHSFPGISFAVKGKIDICTIQKELNCKFRVRFSHNGGFVLIHYAPTDIKLIA